jgi:tRNA-2-methylthio-N6-dimethylallyladenosine synthase
MNHEQVNTSEAVAKSDNLDAAKKMYIKTYGCQMNFYDSEKMQNMLKPMGFGTTEQMEDSDLVIINTCHIREKATEKVFSELGQIRKIKAERKKEGKRTIIAVAGCVAQAEGEEIKARAPFVDIIVGPQSYQRLPLLVNNIEAGSKTALDLDFSTIGKFDFLNEEIAAKNLSPENKKVTAFLTIQEGCDKFCTFCVVPYTRGPEYSRNISEIYREAIKLVSEGVKEITLLGQNVNAYHGKGPDGDVWGLGKLIRHLANIKGLERIRYSTSHPRDMDDDLILAHAEVEKLMPFVHLPVQSGSDRILKLMNRKHTSDDYRRVIDKFRKAVPNIEFSSDFIVGYPNETEEEHQETMKLIKDVGFSMHYSFTYSARPGTPAANLEDNIPKEVKHARLIELQALLEQQVTHFNANKLGGKFLAMIDRKGKFAGQAVGFLPTTQPVVIENADHLIGEIVSVEIYDIMDRGVKGKIIAA